MDEQSLRDRLELAEADIARTRMLIVRQRERIATGQKRGEPTEEAAALLADYEQMLEIHKSDREWVRAELAALS